MLFSPVFVESHPCRSLDPFAGLTPISYPLKPNSLRLNLFADPHPLNLYATIFYKKAGRGEGFSGFQEARASSLRDEKTVTATPLFPSLTNCDARKPFRIRSYANCRVTSFKPIAFHSDVFVNPFDATLMSHLRKCCKQKTYGNAKSQLNPLAATLTKNRGEIQGVTSFKPKPLLSPNQKPLFLYAVLQQILQLAHELLHVFEIHIHRRKPHVRHLIQLFQPVHDHFADFRGRQLAFRGFLHHAFDFVHDSFQLWRGHGPFFASFQESLQNLLPLKALPPPVLLDDHVRNFVNAFVRCKPAATLQAFATAANRVAHAAFPRIDHLVVNVRAKRTLHGAASPCWAVLLPAASFSCFAISRSFPKDNPSCARSGAPTRLHPAKVTR